MVDLPTLLKQEPPKTDEVKKQTSEIVAYQNEVDFQIAYSRWLNLIKNIGYDDYYTIVFQRPHIIESHFFKKAIQHFNEATNAYISGGPNNYVITECRKAIESIRNSFTRSKKKALKQDAENLMDLVYLTHLEQAKDYEEPKKQMSDIISRFEKFAHNYRHDNKKAETALYATKYEAEFYLRTTANIISFLSRSIARNINP